MVKIMGSYILLTEGVELQFNNMITNSGIQSLKDPLSTGVHLLTLSSNITPPEFYDTEVLEIKASTKTFDIERGFKEIPGKPYWLCLNSFTFEFFNLPSFSLSKLGVYTKENKLFSQSLIKDAEGKPITLDIQQGSKLTVIYQLRALVNNPSVNSISETGASKYLVRHSLSSPEPLELDLPYKILRVIDVRQNRSLEHLGGVYFDNDNPRLELRLKGVTEQDYMVFDVVTNRGTVRVEANRNTPMKHDGNVALTINLGASFNDIL